MYDADELCALAFYYAERWSDPAVCALERDTVLIVFLACLSALGLWHPSADRLAWSETDPHERIRRGYQA